MALINVQTKSTLIGSFKDELIGGESLSEFAKQLEEIDVNDADNLQRAARRPKAKCNGWTITVGLLAEDPSKKGQPGSVQHIEFECKLDACD